MAHPSQEMLSTFNMMCRRLQQHGGGGGVDDLNVHTRRRHTDQMCILRSYDKNINTVILVICNIYCYLQSGARNVIPLIVHVTHFYYYKNI